MKQFSIAIMAKEPVAGGVKTRLTPAISASVAAYLYETLLLDTVDTVLSVKEAEKYLFYSPSSSTYFTKFERSGIKIYPQVRGDLGKRMSSVFKHMFSERAIPAIIAGSDIPGLKKDSFTQAFENLSGNDLVIGPTPDGGYYLIGMHKYSPGLFQNIPWSTEEVLYRTIKVAGRWDLSMELIENLPDMDRVNDLVEFADELERIEDMEILRKRFSRALLKMKGHLERLREGGM